MCPWWPRPQGVTIYLLDSKLGAWPDVFVTPPFEDSVLRDLENGRNREHLWTIWFVCLLLPGKLASLSGHQIACLVAAPPPVAHSAGLRWMRGAGRSRDHVQVWPWERISLSSVRKAVLSGLCRLCDF